MLVFGKNGYHSFFSHHADLSALNYDQIVNNSFIKFYFLSLLRDLIICYWGYFATFAIILYTFISKKRSL